MKHSKCLLVSAVLGSLYLCYVIFYFGNELSITTGWEQVGVGIATALVAPHMFLLGLAVLFNWISYFGNYRWAALTGGILYGVSAFSFLLYVLFEIPSIVLSFVGFVKLRDLPAPGGLPKAKQCVYCGAARERGELFSKYGFCEECNDQTRNEIEGKIGRVKKVIAELNEVKTNNDQDAALKKVADGLGLLDYLEEMRKKVPAFKSSTAQYRSALVELKNRISSLPVAAPTAASTDLPEKLDGLELKYNYEKVYVAGVAYRDFDFSLLKIGDLVTLTQEPENEFDNKAVALYCHDVKIGYMHRNRLQEMANSWFEHNHPIYAQIESLNAEGQIIGIRMGFYQPPAIEFEASDDAEEISCSSPSNVPPAISKVLTFQEFDDRLNAIVCVPINLSQNAVEVPAPTEKPEIKTTNVVARSNLDTLSDFTVVDVETTGFSSTNNDIIEVSATRFRNFAATEMFSTLINPQKHISDEITQITGITNQMVADSPRFCQIASALTEFLGKDNIIGHNLQFDVRFLFANGVDLSAGKRRFYDTLQLSRNVLRPRGSDDRPYGGRVENCKLTTLCDYYQINRSTAHRSASDCLATGLLFEKLVHEIIE